MKSVLMIAMSLFALNQAQASLCAVLSTSAERGHGSKLEVSNGMSITDLNSILDRSGEDLDNRVSKIAVMPGCALTGYQYQNFNYNKYTGQYMGGFALTYSGYSSYKPSVYEMQHRQDDRISSVSCRCSN